MAYQLGETIRFTATITDAAGNAADPASVKINILQTDGVLIVDSDDAGKVETGVYNYDYTPIMIGTHRYNIVAIGGGGKITIVKNSFFVEVAL